ncbi:MAG: hypothetical protein ABIH71_00300 [Candidatus Omnitrophota bacterium]|nr:hypothetical protein [Candidatus Omnitrophota bacterium]
MELPRDNSSLTEIFKTANSPRISDFNGEYFVDMLTVLPSLRKFSHRKVFYSEDNQVLGYNLLFNKFVWGHFFVEESKELDCPNAIINYDSPRNSFLTNKIRDYVRRVDENTFLGKFTYLVMGRQYFLGYFSLSKAK